MQRQMPAVINIVLVDFLYLFCLVSSLQLKGNKCLVYCMIVTSTNMDYSVTNRPMFLS